MTTAMITRSLLVIHLLTTSILAQQSTTAGSNAPLTTAPSPASSALTTSSATSSATIMTATPCPTNELNYVHGGKQWCCPGAIFAGFNDDQNSFCCVGADFDNMPGPDFPDCLQNCTSTGTEPTKTAPQACSATVLFTDADYAAKVTSAAQSVSAESATRKHSKTSKGGAAPAAAMVTSGPMMGAVMAVGGMLLAI